RTSPAHAGGPSPWSRPTANADPARSFPRAARARKRGPPTMPGPPPGRFVASGRSLSLDPDKTVRIVQASGGMFNMCQQGKDENRHRTGDARHRLTHTESV